MVPWRASCYITRNDPTNIMHSHVRGHLASECDFARPCTPLTVRLATFRTFADDVAALTACLGPAEYFKLGHSLEASCDLFFSLHERR